MTTQVNPSMDPAAGMQPVTGHDVDVTDSAVELRPGTVEDAPECGRICYEAFRTIAALHNFPEDFADADAATQLFDFAMSQPDIYVVIAELDGRIVGSNLSWEQTPVAGIGPITVDPQVQNRTIGRLLMQDVLDRGQRCNHIGIRLVQAAYHGRSLALYTKLGFRPQEPLSVFQGPPVNASLPGHDVRPARAGDINACARIGERLHGFSRAGELVMAVAQGTAKVVERDGEITGYATDVGFFGHATGMTNRDILALIASATSFAGPGFLVPTRNTVLMRWCLEHGLRIVQPMTLMTRGFYHSPKGSYLPSILF